MDTNDTPHDPAAATGGTRIGVDVGGTFTDVALSLEERLVTAKVPTTDPQHVGVVEGIRKACETAGIEPEDLDEFAHAMTVSVNALLERGGAETALVTTAGFRDVLEIARQDRPDLYDLSAEKPEPLVARERRFEVDERTTAEGVEREININDVRTLAATLRERDVEAVAVCLLHAYADSENERVVAETLREELDVPVSASHEVLAEFREYERTSTTAVDAYVRPAIDRYVGQLVDEAADAGMPAPRIMQANGGIADPRTVRKQAVTTTLSGPAAGVVGASATVADDEREGLVTFDMGGTSSDVSLVRDGRVERTTDAEIAGLPIRTPMVDVNTVGAGGGSIAWVDSGGALRVGPHSASADPGPACYGQGGTAATVTDANVVLGYIGPETVLGGEMSLDLEAAREAVARLADEAGLGDGLEAARGVYRVANATMTRTIRAVTVERGHDPREFALVAFGGAGPMHAAALAESLGIDSVVVPRPSGVLSAFGLLAADESYDAVRTVGVELGGSRSVSKTRSGCKTTRESADASELEAVYGNLVTDVLADASEPEAARVERAADCRYTGQSFELTVPVGADIDLKTVADRFHDAHDRAFGYSLEETIEIVNLRATATIPGNEPTIRHERAGDALVGSREVYFATDSATGESESGDQPTETAVYDRDRLETGASVSGPAVLEQAESTTVVPPSWAGTVRKDGALAMTRGVADR